MKTKTKTLGLIAAALVLVAGVSVYFSQTSTTNLEGAVSQPIIYGACGLTTYGTPACSSGAYSNVGADIAENGTVTWNWKCLNIGVGATGGATCAAIRPAIDGECGTANAGVALSASAAGTLCAKGSYSNLGNKTADDGVVTFNWKCMGQYGGATPACFAYKLGTTISGSCGSASGSCGTGKAGDATVSSSNIIAETSSWSCAGHGGPDASCSVTQRSQICNFLDEQPKSYFKERFIGYGSYDSLISSLNEIKNSDTLQEGIEKDPFNTYLTMLSLDASLSWVNLNADASPGTFIELIAEVTSSESEFDAFNSSTTELAKEMLSNGIDPEVAFEEALASLKEMQNQNLSYESATQEDIQKGRDIWKKLYASLKADYYQSSDELYDYMKNACSGGASSEEATQKILDEFEEAGISSSDSNWKEQIQEIIDALSADE